MNKFKFQNELSSQRVLPIVTGVTDPKKAVDLASTLKDAGLKIMELPIRGDTAAILKCISAIRKDVPAMITGAGTVMTREALLAANDAGAQFGVSPGLTPTLEYFIHWTQTPFIPGVATLSEAMAATERGYDTLKWFPAETLGGRDQLAEYASIMGREVLWVPTGKITQPKVDDYLRIPEVISCGGSWVTPKDLVATGNWEEVAKLAKLALK